MKRKIITPEFTFVLYVFGFATLRPVLWLFRPWSSAIISIFMAANVFASLLECYMLEEGNFAKWITVSTLFGILLLFSPAKEAEKYIVNFFMYGCVSLFLLINVNDYKAVLEWVVKLSCVNGALLIFDPFFGYRFNGGYMEYGFNMLMFSFTGVLLGFFYLRKKKYFCPMIAELLMISFYGNKGACITAVILFLGGMYLSGNSITKMFFCIVVPLSMVGWKTIMQGVIDLAKYLNVSSYSITTIQMMISDKAEMVYSVRTSIWENALNWILRKPFLGYGIGVFEAETNGYAHNIFLDIALSFGCLGLLFFVVVFLHSIYKMCCNTCVEYKVLQACCLICGLVPMQFSLTFWNVSIFWVYWGLYLYDSRYRRLKIESISSDV